MASVKSLNRCPSQSHYNSHYEQKVPLAKSYSYSGTSTPQASNHWFNRKALSSSFDSAHRRLSVYMLQLLTPITTSSSIFDCYSHHAINNLDISLLPALGTSVDSLIHREINMPSQNINHQLASAEGTSIQLPCCTVSAVPSDSLHYSAMDKEDSILCSSVSNSNKSSVSEENLRNKTTSTEIMESGQSSSLEDNKVPPGCSRGNVIFNNNYKERSPQSAKKTSSCYSQQSDVPCNSVTQDKIRMVGTSVDVSVPGFTLKPQNNLALVLSTPRKIVKKGRPSSKKQRKRKREKGKHESSPLQTKEVSSPTKVHSEIKQSHLEAGYLEFASVQSQDPLQTTRTPSSKFKNNHDKESTPEIPTSRLCPSACLIFRLKSSSEETDVDADDTDEWSMNENNTICMSPIDSYGFNFALNLESIFKKANIHESVSSSKENGDSATVVKNSGCQNLMESFFFKSDSYDDSDVEICASPVSTEFSDNNYITPLSLNILFPARNGLKNQTTANLLRNSVEFLDDHSSSDNSSTCLQETDFETLDRINAQWDEHYPSAGFRSCNPGDDIIQDTSIKVHFATEPDLLTVHVLEEEEDRSGPWQHFAVDRERFERRILELERIISPVLDADHRVKILEHRIYPKKQ